MPAAIENRFCSAIPMLKNRCGNTLMKGITSVYFDKSADRATTSGLRRPSATSACPNGASVMLRGEFSNVLLFTIHLPLVNSLACLGRLAERREFLLELVPVAGFDADEMSLLAPLQARYALARSRAQHDDMRNPGRGSRPMQ